MIKNPIDDDKQKQIEECITTVMGTFAKAYPMAYAVALFNKVKEETLSTDEPSEYQLEARPEKERSTEPLKTGFLTKEGAIRKSWKKRFFVIRPDYKVEYYDKEETYKSGGKPKGIIAPAGYWVSTDLRGDFQKKLEKAAELLKVDISDLPKPKTYPEFTFGLLHDRRRHWYITADNQAEFDAWVDAFRQCCRNAEGLLDQERVAKEAYYAAFDKTREFNGYYDWWNFEGTETENLTDLISRKVSRTVLDDVLSNLDVPSKMKSMAQEKVESFAQSLIGSAVATGWNASSSAIKSCRGSLEEKVKGAIEPVVKAQRDVVEKITAAISDKVTPAVETHVAPLLGKILPILITPLTRAFENSFDIYLNVVGEAEKTISDDKDRAFRRLASEVRWSWTVRPATEVIDAVADVLSTLEEIPMLRDLSTVNGLLSTGKQAISELLDRAAYTFEKTVKSLSEGGADAKDAAGQARDIVLTKFKHDALVKIADAIKDMLTDLFMPKIDETVGEACRSAIEPISAAVPDAVKEFVDPDAMMSDVISGFISNVVAAAVDPALPKSL